MISHKYKVGFIHIPKTAGRSIEKAFNENPQRHRTIEQMNEELRHEKYYYFSVVRNPLDRLVSTYFYLKSRNELPYEPNMTFEEFVNIGYDWWSTKNFETSTTIGKKKNFYFSPQTNWLVRNEKIMVDKIIKFEKINEQFKLISNLFKLKTELPHLNSSIHKHYKYYYDFKLKIKVKEWFQSDFDLFYNFL